MRFTAFPRVAVLCALVSAPAGVSALGEGCYSTADHTCSCPTETHTISKATCEGAWTQTCACAVPSEDTFELGCPWAMPAPDRYGKTCRMKNETLVKVGAELVMQLSPRSLGNIVLVDDSAFASCDIAQHTVMLECCGGVKHSSELLYAFNEPGTYYITSDAAGACAAGVKQKVVVYGASSGKKNEHSLIVLMAPTYTSSGGTGFVPFGKGIYHDRAYDGNLHTACDADASTYCLDRQASRGSCYYAGEDKHIGHGVFCDVTEEKCCGYRGCSAKDYRGMHQNGSQHDYYWYPTGYVSRGGCCHCKAGCNATLETPALAGGTCGHYDVTTSICQRNPAKNDPTADSIGFLKCAAPAGAAPPVIRENSSESHNGTGGQGDSGIGCYDLAKHSCSCDVADEAACDLAKGMWTARCGCGGATAPTSAKPGAGAGAGGCYDPAQHSCNCGVANKAACSQAAGVWSSRCCAGAGSRDQQQQQRGNRTHSPTSPTNTTNASGPATSTTTPSPADPVDSAARRTVGQSVVSAALVLACVASQF